MPLVLSDKCRSSSSFVSSTLLTRFIGTFGCTATTVTVKDPVRRDASLGIAEAQITADYKTTVASAAVMAHIVRLTTQQARSRN